MRVGRAAWGLLPCVRPHARLEAKRGRGVRSRGQAPHSPLCVGVLAAHGGRGVRPHPHCFSFWSRFPAPTCIFLTGVGSHERRRLAQPSRECRCDGTGASPLAMVALGLRTGFHISSYNWLLPIINIEIRFCSSLRTVMVSGRITLSQQREIPKKRCA